MSQKVIIGKKKNTDKIYNFLLPQANFSTKFGQLFSFDIYLQLNLSYRVGSFSTF